MRVLKETKLQDFDISGITKNAIDEKGIKKPRLISITVVKDVDVEFLFEVDSSSEEHHKVDLQGNEKPSNKGYATVLRFVNFPKVLDGEKLSKENIEKVINECDVKVHCDCPSFYFQGMQQEDYINNNARFRFQGQGGLHTWTGKHKDAGGKIGSEFCKHLFSCREWLEDNLEEVQEKLVLEEKRILRRKLRIAERNLHRAQRELLRLI